MRIATWNVERLKHRSSLDEIRTACERTKADIFVLTETDTQLNLPYEHIYYTTPPAPDGPVSYRATERRAAICTDYVCVQRHRTYDEHTAICVELETEYGRLLVYATIIGVFGNRHPSFMEDVCQQANDFSSFTSEAKSLCICGDFNCSFSDNYYYTKAGRERLSQIFAECSLQVLTADVPECIDHIVVSSTFIKNRGLRIEEWNVSKKLSDHKGVLVQTYDMEAKYGSNL